MSLTREECLKAYEDLKVDGSYTIAYKSNFDKAYSKIEEHNRGLDVFEQLIDEHFYNPPLTKDDLMDIEISMYDTVIPYIPIWDNVLYRWRDFNCIEDDRLCFYAESFLADADFETFEEGRFFRSMVK